MRQEVKDDFEVITDCFMGYDGAVSYTRLMALITKLDKAYIGGDEKAGQILIVLRQFANLVRVAAGQDKIRED